MGMSAPCLEKLCPKVGRPLVKLISVIGQTTNGFIFPRSLSTFISCLLPSEVLEIWFRSNGAAGIGAIVIAYDNHYNLVRVAR